MSKLGDTIQLASQEVEVVACEDCDALMVNIDESELEPGDMKTLKQNGVRISNPHTDDAICIKCEIEREDAENDFKRKVNDYFEPKSEEKKDDDDDHLFGGFGGNDTGFGSGDSFGGFGGGSFSGGGASGDF